MYLLHTHLTACVLMSQEDVEQDDEDEEVPSNVSAIIIIISAVTYDCVSK